MASRCQLREDYSQGDTQTMAGIVDAFGASARSSALLSACRRFLAPLSTRSVQRQQSSRMVTVIIDR